jgi:hypothetical protein
MKASRFTVQVRLRGGLGNQLSGLYAGLFLSSSHNARLVLDGRFIKFGGNVERALEIDKLDFGIQRSNLEFLPAIPLPKSRLGMKMARPALQTAFNFLTRSETSEVLTDANSLLNQNLNSDVVLDGYFPTYEYFDHYKARNKIGIVKPVNPSNLYLKMADFWKPQVSVHLRIGDYLNHPDIYPILTNDYYENALNQTSADAYGYSVFAENFEEAKMYFPQLMKNANHVFTKKDFSTVESFCLMARSSEIITANSSFSNWAAKLVEGSGGKVVCPEQMFKEKTIDLRPENWLRINF